MNLASAGYVFSFQDKGAFAPDGKVAGQPSQTEIDEHNRELAKQEIEAMKQTGRAVLYLFRSEGVYVGTWASKPPERIPCQYRTSFHNMAGKDGRTDVWFTFHGSLWHGVNIGDNDIVRCKRTKQKAGQ